MMITSCCAGMSEQLLRLIKSRETDLELIGVLFLNRSRLNQLKRVEQGSEEWKEARKIYLGASEVTLALSKADYCDARQFLKRKIEGERERNSGHEVWFGARDKDSGAL
jgi:predicted adenine nucleotide alpha hydrolase (AANH) superfamily ATPase